MIAQCKGKDLNKVPASKLLQDGWYPSIKYDGNYVQIEKLGDIVRFWTSGGKQFYIRHIANELINRNPNVSFIIECEYIADTDGKLGSRGKCTTTTYRTNFAKGLPNRCTAGQDIFKAFDCIRYEEDIGQSMTHFGTPFKIRRTLLKELNLGTHISLAGGYDKKFSLANIKVDGFIRDGYEGLFLIHEDHIYKPGKRVNNAIKLKRRPTADLRCIDVEYSLINPNDLGALVLIDSEDRVCKCKVLTDALKAKEPDYFIGRVVEIEYEQIQDTYIQPVYKCLREEKEIS